VVTFAGVAISSADIDELVAQQVPGATRELFDFIKSVILGIGIVALILGLLHILSSIGVFAHRGWGRFLGLLFGLLGVLLGILSVLGSSGGTQVMSDGTRVDLSRNMGPSIAFLAIYLFVFIALLIGGKHFRRQRLD